MKNDETRECEAGGVGRASMNAAQKTIRLPEDTPRTSWIERMSCNYGQGLHHYPSSLRLALVLLNAKIRQDEAGLHAQIDCPALWRGDKHTMWSCPWTGGANAHPGARVLNVRS